MSFIKLDRKIQYWGWYGDPSVLAVWIHILIDANFKENVWQGMTIKPGELVTSVSRMSLETGLSVQQVRTALKKLESTNEIRCKTTNKYTLIHVCKWSQYQTNNEQSTSEPTSGATCRVTTPKECKEYKNVNKPPFIPPKVEEVEEYCRSRGNGIDASSFVDFYTSKGWMVGKNKMKDWKAAVRTWERSRAKEEDTTVPIYDDTRNRDLSDEDLADILKEMRRT